MTLVGMLAVASACSNGKPAASSSPSPSATSTPVDVARVDDLILRTATAFRLLFGLEKTKERAEYLATLDLVNADLGAVIRELTERPPAGVPEDEIRSVAAKLEALVSSQRALRTCFGTSKSGSSCASLRKAASDRFSPAAESIAGTLGNYGSRSRSDVIALWNSA